MTTKPWPAEPPDVPSVEEPEASGEPEKPCKQCSVTKPLSEFPRNGTYNDGHTNKCKPCTRKHQKRKTRESRERREQARNDGSQANGSSVTPIRSATKPTSGAEARLCANGKRCAAVHPDDLVPQPAILDEANPGPLCRRCKQRAGVA